MIFGILSPIVFIILIVLFVIKVRSGNANDGIHGESVKRFFQYALLFGLIVVVANGFTGLLARWVESSDVMISDQTDLARNVSFVLVGVPLYIVIALWIRRQYFASPAEAKSFGWALYFTLTSLTFLIGFSFSLRGVFSWGVGLTEYQGYQAAQFIIWGGLWLGHLWLGSRLTPLSNLRAQFLIGSLYGLVFLVVGLIELLSGAISRMLKVGGDSLFISQKDSVLEGGVTVVVGLFVWYLYWLRTAVKSSREIFWLAYVMLVGVGGGVVMAIVSLSQVFYTSLVWILGTPSTNDAAYHFKSFPVFAAAALVGGALWWYHRTVLQDAGPAPRTEVRRVYEYLMSAIGLLASAVGFAIVLVALVDAFTESEQIVGSRSHNTLLAALTLLVVGGLVWYIYWSRIQKFVSIDGPVEYAAPTRRIYLYLLFGVGGLTAAITLLVGTFFLFDDIFAGNFGEETFRRIRTPLALILTTGAVAGYHWFVYRAEREYYVDEVATPRFVILVGPYDSELLQEISAKSGAKIQAWSTTGVASVDWNTDCILKAIASSGEENLLILGKGDGLVVVPVFR